MVVSNHNRRCHGSQSKYKNIFLSFFAHPLTNTLLLYSLMSKFSKKLVSKCIYIQILKSSDTDLLWEFMSSSGWSLTHLWLQDAITTQNWPLVQEILELLLSCPVDVERLKSNSAPRLVKQLTKDSHVEGVRVLANKLVEQWLRIVRGETVVITNKADAVKPVPEIEEVNVIKEEPIMEEEQEEKEPEKEKIILKISVKDQVIVKPDAAVAKSPIKEVPKEELVVEEEVTTEEINEVETTQEEEPNSSLNESAATDKTEKSKKDEKTNKDRDRSKSSKHRSSSKSSSSSSSSKSKSSSRDKDRERDKHKSSSSSSSTSKSKSSSSSSKDKEKRKEKKEKIEEIPQSVKDAKALVESAPHSVIKLGKIPKKPRTDDDSNDKKVSSKTAPVAPKVKPTFSIEERDPEKRAKTVKTFNSKFRSHGLEGYEPPPPPIVRKDSKTTTPTTTSTTTPSAPKRVSPVKNLEAQQPPEKKPKLESNGIKSPTAAQKAKRKYLTDILLIFSPFLPPRWYLA